MPEYLYKFVGLSKEFCESIDALPIINQGESILEKLLRNSVMESKFSLDLQKLYTLTDNKLYFSQPGNFNDRHEHSFPMDLAYLEKLRMKNNMPANPDLAMLKKLQP